MTTQQPVEAGMLTNTADTSIVHPRRVLATPRSRHNVRNTVIGLGITAGLTIAGAFGLRAVMSQPGGSPDISPTHPAATDTFKAPTNTPRVEITPDHFPLNPKTVKEGAIGIIPNGLPPTETAPYGFIVNFHALTVENVETLPDGSQVVTLALPGGQIERTDQNRSVANHDGTTQEEYVFAGSDAAASNNVVRIVIDKGTATFSESGKYVGQALGTEFTPGSANHDFNITLNGRPGNKLPVSQLLQSAGGNLSGLQFSATTVTSRS
jgi:hypothetical protein